MDCGVSAPSPPPGGPNTALFAIGYGSVGGAVALDLARHPGVGASELVAFNAISSINGRLAPLGTAAAVGGIVSNVQIHHAESAVDSDLAMLERELSDGVHGTLATWEMIKYGKVQGEWPEPATDHYDARAAQQAHRSTFAFFEAALNVHNERPIEAFPLFLPGCDKHTAENLPFSQSEPTTDGAAKAGHSGLLVLVLGLAVGFVLGRRTHRRPLVSLLW
jgi:hypothetical protein